MYSEIYKNKNISNKKINKNHNKKINKKINKNSIFIIIYKINYNMKG